MAVAEKHQLRRPGTGLAEERIQALIDVIAVAVNQKKPDARKLNNKLGLTRRKVVITADTMESNSQPPGKLNPVFQIISEMNQ